MESHINHIGKLIADVLEENEIGYKNILFIDGTDEEDDYKDLGNNEDTPNILGSRDLLNSDQIYEREKKDNERAKEVFKIPKFPSWAKLTLKGFYKWSDDEIFLVYHFSELLANATTAEELNKIEGEGWEDEYERNEMVKEVLRWLGHDSFGGIKASGYENGEYFEKSYFPPFCLHLKQSKIEKIMKRRLNGDDYAFEIAKDLSIEMKDNLINTLLHFLTLNNEIRMKRAAGLTILAKVIKFDFMKVSKCLIKDFKLPPKILINTLKNVVLGISKIH